MGLCSGVWDVGCGFGSLLVISVVCTHIISGVNLEFIWG